MDVRLSQQAHREPPAVRRFGWALVVSSALVASIAGIVYLWNPTAPLQPTVIASAPGFNRAGFTQPDGGDATVEKLLGRFVNALEHEDVRAMRAIFPGMTPHDARVLRALRRRLGPGAHLSVKELTLKTAAEPELQVEFVVLSKTPGSHETLRLPFEARVTNARGAWQIVKLH